MSRRTVQTAVALAASLVLAVTAHAGPAPGLVSGQELRPPQVVRAHGGILRHTLTLAEGAVELGGRTVGGFKAYNGLLPGPTLRIEPGDRLALTVENRLAAEPTNLHTHGLHVDPSGIADNVLRHMDAGTANEVVIDVPRDHEQGLFWYHPHLHGQVNDQVYSGAAGLLEIGDPLRPFRSLRGIGRDVIVLQAVTLAPDLSSLVPEGDPAGETLLVNGQVAPVVRMRPGEVRLWRLANASNDHFYRLRLDGHRFHVLARDGNTLDRLWTKRELVLGPAQRVDLLVRAGTKRGTFALEQLPYDQGFQQFPRATILTVEIAGTPVAARTLPRRLLPFEELRGRPDERRTLNFTIETQPDGAPEFLINGAEFDHDVVNETVRLGTLQEWTLINRSGEAHPFHLHTNDFLVTSVNGKPVAVRGYQDTVILPIAGWVTIRFRATDFLGKAVYHCHILFHEDHGMMGIVEWVPAGGSQSPPGETDGHVHRAP